MHFSSFLLKKMRWNTVISDSDKLVTSVLNIKPILYEWCLFITKVTTSIKIFLLHYGNIFSSILLAYDTNMEENNVDSYLNVQKSCSKLYLFFFTHQVQIVTINFNLVNSTILNLTGSISSRVSLEFIEIMFLDF